MKNLHFSSRETDTAVLIALLCAGCAAILGFCVKPPPSALGDDWISFFDAAICALLAVLVWSGFHLCNFQNLRGVRLATAIIGSTVLWLVLVIGLLLIIHPAITDPGFLDGISITIVMNR